MKKQRPLIILQNCQIESAGTIIDWAEERHTPVQVMHTYQGGALPDPTQTGGVICLGTPLSMRDYQEHDFLVRLHQFVEKAMESDVPVLGICFGSQLLAHVLGAEVKRSPVLEIGTYEVKLTSDGARDPAFAGFPQQFNVFHWHGDTFDLPPGVTLLVEGTDCPHQAFRHGRTLGLQFHLEASPSEVPVWCDTYADELAGFGRSAEELCDEYRGVADETQRLAFRFLDNVFAG